MIRATRIERSTLALVTIHELTGPRRVELRGPADQAFVRLARTATLSIASQAGLAVDPCDELRIAVDESCNTLIGFGADELTIDFIEDEATLQVCIRSNLREVAELQPTAQLVLATMVDELDLDEPGTIVLHKRLG